MARESRSKGTRAREQGQENCLDLAVEARRPLIALFHATGSRSSTPAEAIQTFVPLAESISTASRPVGDPNQGRLPNPASSCHERCERACCGQSLPPPYLYSK